MRLLIVIIAIAVSHAQISHAESKNSSPQVGLSISFGIHPGGNKVNILHDYPNATINTKLGYGSGVSVGNIDFLYSSKIGFAIEISALPFDADQVQRSDGATMKYDGFGVPILLWSEVSQPGKFGPFIKIGVGTIHMRFTYRYERHPWYNSGYDFWSFAYGLGGGLRYLISENIECLFVVEGYNGTDGADSINEFGWKAQSTAPFGLGFIGLRARYWF